MRQPRRMVVLVVVLVVVMVVEGEVVECEGEVVRGREGGSVVEGGRVGGCEKGKCGFKLGE